MYWVNLAQAQDEGLRFWQTRTNAVISLCWQIALTKQFLRKGNCTLFERLSTPRPATKIVLTSAWQSQQQQQDTSESASSSTRTRKVVQRVHREEKGNPTDNPEQPSARKLERSAESRVEKEPAFKVDFRIEGIAQDVILKDEEWTGKIQEVVKKLRKWFTHEIYIGRSGKTRKTPWYSARNPVASSMKWATSSCTTWDR